MVNLRSEILIIEDDQTLAEALNAAFSREGFTVHITTSSAVVENLLQTKPIGTIFIDCLLPDMSGVEFSEELRKKYPPSIVEIILMSGILTEATFIKESMKSAQAKHFLKKPFDLEEALSLVSKPAITSKNSEAINPRKKMYEIYREGRVSSQARKEVIENLDEIYGFDLPFVYSLIIDSRASGELEIKHLNQLFAKVSFLRGNVVGVQLSEKDANVGKMLVDAGFIHPDDLIIAENDKSNKRFGAKVVSNFLASPHGLDLVLMNQLNIRLSKTVVDKKFHVSFTEKEPEDSLIQIDTESFLTFLHDWVASKIPLDWLKAQFLQWNSAKIQKTIYYKEDHPALQLPLVKSLPGFIESVTRDVVLQEIIEAKIFAEEPVYKLLMFLLSKGIITFEEVKVVLNADEQLKILNRLLEQFKGAKQGQIYDWMALMISGDPSHPDDVLLEFKKIIGDAPNEKNVKLNIAYKTVLGLIEDAADYVKSGRREQAEANLIKSENEKALRLSEEMRKINDLLMRNNFKAAIDTLKSIHQDAQGMEKYRLYSVWGQIGNLDTNLNRQSALKSIEMELLQVPPEDRLDPLFSYISGLIAKAKGEKAQARKFFEKSLALDSKFINAKRELTLLASDSGRSGEKKDSQGIFGLFKK